MPDQTIPESDERRKSEPPDDDEVMPSVIWACIDQYTEEGWWQADERRTDPHFTDTRYVRGRYRVPLPL